MYPVRGVIFSNKQKDRHRSNSLGIMRVFPVEHVFEGKNTDRPQAP